MTNAENLLGRVIGGVYAIERIIATGSTSIVYKGTHTRLGQPLAIKVLAGSVVANESLMARFEAEARVQARLNHPHIVTVYDFVAEDGIYAIVMEYVAGIGLDQLMYDIGGPMDVQRIKNIILPVLEAVGYAHEQDVVHRDVKPSNILIAEVGGRDFPKVMDFGIAKVAAEGAAVTAPGAMVGTLLFMSPEQCKALKTVDWRADIYALGVTLYQMATAMVPFYSESAFDIMLAHVEVPPTPPRELAPDLPADLEQIILKALAKDPEDRFHSTKEMAEALDAVGSGSAASPRGATHQGMPPVAPPRLTGETPPPAIEELSGMAADASNAMGTALSTGPHPPQSLTRSRTQQDELSHGQRTGEHSRAGSSQRQRRAQLSSAKRGGKELPNVEDAALRHRKAGPISSATLRSLRAPHTEHEPVSKMTLSGVGRDSTDDFPVATRSHEGSQELRLRLRVPSREDWDRFFDPNMAGGGVFCPINHPPEVGTHVHLEVTFVGGPRFFFPGIVTWRRTQTRDARTRAGVGVQIHLSQQTKLAYLLNWVKGTMQDKRSQRRLPLKFRVIYSGRTGRRVNFTRDVCEDGIFVRSRELLDLKTPIQIVLAPPTDSHYKPFRLEGRVARLSQEADDRGMGISLIFHSSLERSTFAEFIDEMERALLAGELPEEVLTAQ